MKNKFAQRFSRWAQGGFSIPEGVFALGIGALAVAGGMAVNQEELRMVKSTRESSGASLALEERVEQLRLATWRQITTADYIEKTYFKSTPRSSRPLGSLTEYVTITAFPDSSACTPLKLERTPNGVVRVVEGGAGLAEQKLAKVDVGMKWIGKGGRHRTRELATVISNAGISRMNLPSMGAGLAGTSNTSTSTDTPTSTEGTNTTPTTDTTPESGNGNGNGNGRGNVGGKPGKA